MFNIGIVGTGWYGCHIALSLLSLGFDVRVFEQNDQLMQEASGNNQFRLHCGFHYARHATTRLQSRDGFQRFVERYPTLSTEVSQNIYAVPKNTSLIDFQTYKLIMAASGINYVEMLEPPELLASIEGCLLAPERVIQLHRAREFFTHRLAGRLELGSPVRKVQNHNSHATIDGRRFDFVIDATWGQLHPLPIPVYYEPTMLLYYECTEEVPAVTLVDGALASIYPTEDKAIHTLSSVPHTPLGRFSTAAEAWGCRAAVNKDQVEAKRHAMESQISINVPPFRDLFKFAGIQLSIKTKPVGQYDDRSCYVFQDGRVFSVMSGKIDTVFFATERILSLIEAGGSLAGETDTPQTLRHSILMRQI